MTILWRLLLCWLAHKSLVVGHLAFSGLHDALCDAHALRGRVQMLVLQWACSRTSTSKTQKDNYYLKYRNVARCSRLDRMLCATVSCATGQVIDMPLLFETGSYRWTWPTVVVTCPETLQVSQAIKSCVLRAPGLNQSSKLLIWP